MARNDLVVGVGHTSSATHRILLLASRLIASLERATPSDEDFFLFASALTQAASEADGESIELAIQATDAILASGLVLDGTQARGRLLCLRDVAWLLGRRD